MGICRSFLRSVLTILSPAGGLLSPAPWQYRPPKISSVCWSYVSSSTLAGGTVDIFLNLGASFSYMYPCAEAILMHLASDYIHPYKDAGGRPAHCRVRIYLPDDVRDAPPGPIGKLSWNHPFGGCAGVLAAAY